MAFFEDLALLSRRERVRLAVLVVVLIGAVVWITTQLLQPGAPRRIVLALGQRERRLSPLCAALRPTPCA